MCNCFVAAKVEKMFVGPCFYYFWKVNPKKSLLLPKFYFAEVGKICNILNFSSLM